MIDNTFTSMVNFPFFSVDEMVELGAYSTNKKFGEPDNTFLDEDCTINTKRWFVDYTLSQYGIITKEHNQLENMRINKLHELYKDYDAIKESGDNVAINARKQSILELGWNPNIDFNLQIRADNDIRMKVTKIHSLFEECIDITNIETIDESKKQVNRTPIFVVLSYTHTTFGKIITKVTDSIYSHTSLALDSSLKKLYSFNANVNGFSLESIDQYKKDKDGIIAVYTVFLKDSDYERIKYKIDDYLLNKKATSYSFLTGLGTVFNIPISIPGSMICSQFVDSILKMVNIDVTNKDSSLVVPGDFKLSTDRRMYSVYEGRIDKYDKNKVDRIIAKVSKKVPKALKEAKEFPASFDADGNLLIKNMKKMDYRHEFEKSHKLLKVYEKDNNIEGIKYELSKLWFINCELEKKIYQSNIGEDEKDKLYVLRSQLLNDFNKYLRVVQSNENGFNFTEYYNDTPFSDASYKIDKYTIQYGTKLIKNLIL